MTGLSWEKLFGEKAALAMEHAGRCREPGSKVELPQIYSEEITIPRSLIIHYFN